MTTTTTIDNCSRIMYHNCTVLCKGPKTVHCKTCRNLPGKGVECVCPTNYQGDARRNGTGCRLNNGQDDGTKTVKIVVGVGIVVALLLTVWLVILVSKWLKRRRNHSQQALTSSLGFNIPNFTKFGYSEIRDACNNFHDSRILGTGGQGTVYEGYLRGGCVKVAIKKSRLEADSYKEFVNETRLLAELRHENIVRVLGYCIDSGHGFIVYELVENGTLYDILHEEIHKLVPWPSRVEIAVGIAGGLNHLHSGSPKTIMHRDIKSRNILLDERCKAKLADFGISRVMEEGATHILTEVKGTPGYLAPENYWSEEQRLAGDVFSFGIVLGEIVTRKKYKFEDDETGQQRLLHEYLRSLDTENKMIKALDKDLLSDDFKSKDNMLLTLQLAQKCCAVTPAARPRMRDVFEELSHMRENPRRDYLTAKQTLASTS